MAKGHFWRGDSSTPRCTAKDAAGNRRVGSKTWSFAVKPWLQRRQAGLAEGRRLFGGARRRCLPPALVPLAPHPPRPPRPTKNEVVNATPVSPYSSGMIPHLTMVYRGLYEP